MSPEEELLQYTALEEDTTVYGDAANFAITVPFRMLSGATELNIVLEATTGVHPVLVAEFVDMNSRVPFTAFTMVSSVDLSHPFTAQTKYVIPTAELPVDFFVIKKESFWTRVKRLFREAYSEIVQ